MNDNMNDNINRAAHNAENEEPMTEAGRENKRIREKRIRMGKIESIVYPVVYILFALFSAFTVKNPWIFFLGAAVSGWLIFGIAFSRQLYTWGSLFYGLWIFYNVTSVMPYGAYEWQDFVLLFAFCLYILFTAIRVFGSEGIRAYLYEKNTI